MAVSEQPNRYVVIVQLDKNSPLSRVAKDVPAIIALIARFSNEKTEIAFKSNDGQLFGVFIRANVDGHIIRAEFEKLASTQGNDHVMIIEIGKIAGGTSGFSRAWTWLQHH